MGISTQMRIHRRRPASVSDRLFVRVAGNGGTPIVLLHGLASSSRYWTPGVPLLAPSHRLIMPDLLGFGRSPKPFRSGYTPAEHVDYLHEALAPLAGTPFTLVGHSMGSILALHYAAAYPEAVSSAVLMSLPVIGCLPWGHNDRGEPRVLHRWMAHTGAGARLAGFGLRLAGPLGYFLAPRIQRDVPVEAARDAMQVTAVSYWRTLEEVVYGADLPVLIKRQQRPLLLVHGADDRIAPLEPVRALAAAEPRTRLLVLQGAGHNPYFTQTGRVAALIMDAARQSLT